MADNDYNPNLPFTRTVTAPGGGQAPVRSSEPPPAPRPAESSAPAPAGTSPAAPVAPGSTPAPPPAQGQPPPAPGYDAATLEAQAHRTALARERQRLLQEKKQIEARDHELAKMQEQLRAQQAEIEQERRLREEAKRDPLAWLKYGGHSYAAAAKQVLNGGDLEPSNDLELAKLTEKLNNQEQAFIKWKEEIKQDQERQAQEYKQREEERAKQEEKAALENFNRQCIDYVNSHKDEYKLTTLFGRQGEVPALIDLYYKQTFEQDRIVADAQGRQPAGRILSHAEAAKMVEDYYQQKTKEAQGIMSPQQAQQAQAGQSGTPSSSPASPAGSGAALTNSMNAPSPPARGGLLSEEERMARAKAAWDAARARRP